MAHPNLKWIPTTVPNLGNITGKVGVLAYDTNLQKHFVIRVNLTSYQQIGGVWVSDAGAIDGSAFYFDAGAVKFTAGAVDVLVCQ